MSGRLTIWGAQQILGSFFGKSYVAPDNFYLALIKNVEPNAYVSGAELDEPREGYERIAIPNNGLWWGDNGQLHVISTEQDVTFATATAQWGVIRYWALCNAPVDGMAYACGDLPGNSLVGIGDIASVAAGDLAITLGPFYAPTGTTTPPPVHIDLIPPIETFGGGGD
jgi:hypothetical protein